MRSKRFYSLPVILVVLLLTLIGCFPVGKVDKTPPVVETPVIALSATTVPESGGGMTVTVNVTAQDAASNLKDAAITLTWNSVASDSRATGSLTKTVAYSAVKSGTATAAFTVNMLGSDFTLTEGSYSFSVSAVVRDVKLNAAEPKTATAGQNLTVTGGQNTITAQASPAAGGDVRINGGTWGDNKSVAVNVGSQETLEARAENGWSFEGWYDGTARVSQSAAYTFNANTSKTYKANFLKSTTSTLLRNLGHEGSLTEPANVYNIIDNRSILGFWSISFLKSRLPEPFKSASGWRIVIEGQTHQFTQNPFNEDTYETDIPDTLTNDIEEIRNGNFETGN